MKKSRMVAVASLGILLLVAATPALAQTENAGPVSGWAAGVCNGFGTAAERIGEVLGMSGQEIADAREDGKSLTDIAKEQGVDREELLEAMMADRTAAIEEAVADGRIGSEQGEDMLQRMEERFEDRMSGESVRPGGGFGPRGGGFGGGCGGPGAGFGGAAPGGCWDGDTTAAETTTL